MLPVLGVLSLLSASSAATVIQVVQSSAAGNRFTKLPDIPFQNTSSPSPSSNGTIIWLSPDYTYQKILGFGGAFTEAAGYNFAKLSPSLQETFVNAYWGSTEQGLGYSLGRVHMNSCDFSLSSYSCDDVTDDFDLKNFNITRDRQYILPLLKLANQESTARNLKVFFSPWSPPAWMKANGQMTGSNKPGLKNDPRVYQSWAKFYSKFADAYRAEGIKFWGATVQNEPLFAAPWEACCYSMEDMAAFIKNYLGPVLQKEQPGLVLMSYDHNRDLVQDWAQGIMADPAVAQYVNGTAFHWYTDSNTPTLNMYGNLDDAHYAASDKFLLATEACYCPGVQLGNWLRGEAYGIDILNDLAHWSTGWVDWNLLLDEQGGPNHLGNMCDAPIIRGNDGSLYFQPSYFFMGHFSKYIDPGSVRIAQSVSARQVCRWRPSATPQQLCDGITWACQNQECPPGSNSCAPDVLYDNADIVYDQWYQSHAAQGPGACDFGGSAILEGIQVVSFLRPFSPPAVATVILNVGDRLAEYSIHVDGVEATSSIGPHSIQTLVWNR